MKAWLLLTFLLAASCQKAYAQARCEFIPDLYFGYLCELHDAVVEEDNFNLVINTDNHEGTNTDASVTGLTIGNNTALRFFPSSLLTQFPNIRYLLLEAAGIENLTPGSLNGCNNVVIMHIRNNNFPTVPAGLFNDCGMLGVLELTGNGITEIHDDAFINIPTILELDLPENNLTRVSASWFRNVPNLEILELRDNQIAEIENGSFNNLPGLYTLYLSNNLLTEITPQMFGDQTGLVFFNVNGNRLTAPPRLPPSPYLRYVYMGSNVIAELTNDAFASGYAEVTNIELSGNQLTQLSADPFTAMPNLDILMVNNNRIESVDHLFFDRITSLFTFYFNGNLCASARYDNIRQNVDVVERTFDRCFYHSFTAETVQTCNFVQDEAFGYTCELSNVTFSTFRNKFTLAGTHLAGQTNELVTGIRIVSSNLARIPPTIFQTFPNIASFSLTDSEFSIIEANTFELCGLTSHMDLSRNRIQRLSRQSFFNCFHLAELILDDNRITEIEPCNSFIMNIYQARLVSMRRNVCVNLTFETIDARLLDYYDYYVTPFLSQCYSLWYMFLDTPEGSSFQSGCSSKRRA